MALPKLFQRIFWHNNTTPAINEDNLNAMSKAIDDIDNRVITLGDDVITVIPQIQAYLDQAEDLVEAMELLSQNPPYIGANGNWYVWDTNTSAFVDSGVDASISVNIADITMLAPDAAPYVTNSGTDTDPIFHLFIPRGQTGNGISTIAKTGTSGLVDTYTITMTDGTTSTFTVTNGSGDMNKSVYDPTNAIANAGGMKSAAAKNSTNAVTANSTDLVESGAVYTADKGIYEVMGQNGCKNLLPIDATTTEKNGVTFTVNDDGSITVSGTASATAIVELNTEIGLDSTKEYILSGCPSGGSENGYRLDAYAHTAGVGGIGNEYGNGIFVRNKSSIVVRIRVGNGTAITTPITFKPMLRLASDTDPTYQPFAETNQQLTQEVDSLNENLNNGAVNLAIPTRAAGSVSSNGVTFSLDGLGRATANNTATANVRLDIAEATLKAGMTYSICEPSSLQSKRVSNVDLCVYARNKSNGTWRLQNNGPRPYYTPSEDEVVSIGIAVPSGTQLTNEQFAPMLVLYGVEVGNNFYYGAKTNRELTEDKVDIVSKWLPTVLEMSNGAISDLNTTLLPDTANNGWLGFNRFSSSATNKPASGGGIVLTYASSNSYGAQLAMGDWGIYFRKNNNGTISSWVRLDS